MKILSQTLHRIILFPLGFTILLLLIRMVIAQDLKYVFLAPNLVLASVPYFLSKALNKTDLKRSTQLILFFSWLLFLPNAPYIITDFIHLRERPPIPYWYDIFLLFTAAFNGIALALLSIREIDIFLSKKFGNIKAARILILSFFLCGFGIYLGRYLRYHSWHIFLYPDEVAYDIVHRFIFPWEHPRTWSITILFGLFLSFTYFSVRQHNDPTKSH